MPARTGKCTNFGLCNKADSRELITIAEGRAFACPECGKALSNIGTPARKLPVKAVAGVFAAALLAVLLFYLFSLWKPGKDHTVAAAPSTAKIILRLSGSNTIGAALAPSLAEAFLKQQGATDVKTVPGNKEDEVRVQGTVPGEAIPWVIEVHAHGSATAFEDLQKNACDVGMASRKIKPAEAGQLANFGDMTAPASEHVLGLDGIAVIVSKNNPVAALSKSQVAQLFTGEITNWAQVGGSSGPVNVYARNDKSGT
ncbi:MAG TPA: substrate-binding domain-containing protein, partial [Terriglobales bacterium]|nr:substrate-binding domain-containing protein [Terriglobales bacterium]